MPFSEEKSYWVPSSKTYVSCWWWTAPGLFGYGCCYIWSSSKCYKVYGLLFKFRYPLNFQLIGHHLNERVEQQASEIAELKALLSQKNSEVQSREEEISDLKRQLEKKDEFLKRISDNLCSACNKRLVGQVEEMDTG